MGISKEKYMDSLDKESKAERGNEDNEQYIREGQDDC